jgi:hypothetical protein
MLFHLFENNFYPAHGVTYSEQRKNEVPMPSSYHPGYKLLSSSTKKLVSKNIQLENSVKMKGGDYSNNFQGTRMRRKDYELNSGNVNSMSFDNIRPFFQVKKFDAFDDYQQNIPAEKELEIMK